MISEIKGNRYNFEVREESAGEYADFSIRAINNNSGRFSSINNLNAILSELEIDDNDSKFWDSDWKISVEEGTQIIEKTRILLSSPSFLAYLENKLDEDRALGEWSSEV